jgi:transposase
MRQRRQEHSQHSRLCKPSCPHLAFGCTAQSLNEWVKKAQIDSGVRGGVPTEITQRLKALERENRELRQANEILATVREKVARRDADRLPFAVAPNKTPAQT